MIAAQEEAIAALDQFQRQPQNSHAVGAAIDQVAELDDETIARSCLAEELRERVGIPVHIADHPDAVEALPVWRTSAPLPKFVMHRSNLRHELRKQRGTSKSMILVPLFDLKFLNEPAATAAGTSNRRH